MKNELLQKYSVRKLNEALANEEHSKIYIVLEKGQYIGTVRLKLSASEPPLKIIDTVVGGKTITDENGNCYSATAVLLAVVANFVFNPILDCYWAENGYL